MYVHGEMLYAQFHNSASDLGNFAGMTYLNTGTTFVKYYNGSAWKTLVTLDGAQVLTAKDYDGGTASNSSRLTVPKAAFSTLNGLTRKQGTLVYDTDSNSLFVDDGSVLNQVGLGSGGGTGGTEYITTGTGEFSTTGFATYADAAATTPVDGTGGSPNSTFARTTTAGQFQRGDAGFIFTKGAANRQGEGFSFDFTLEPADEGHLIGIESCIKFSSSNYNGSTEKMVVYVYDVTNATLISPSVTDIAATTDDGYTFRSSFVAGTSNSYRLIFHVAGTGTTAWNMYIDSISVSSDKVAQSGGTGVYKSFTPTLTGTTANGTVSYTKQIGWYRQNGQNIEGTVLIQANVVTSAPTGNVGFTLPTGFTVNTTIVSDDEYLLGEGAMLDSGGPATNDTLKGVLYYHASSGKLQFVSADSGFVYPALASSDRILVRFNIPVNELAGSSFLGVGEEEYASVSGTWDAAASTTVYGPAGQLMGGALTSEQDKTLTWLTPVLPTDRIEVQFSQDQVHWYPANGARIGGTNIVVIPALNAAGSLASGVSYRKGSSNLQTVVRFERYASIANDDAPVADWPSASAYWRAVKYRKGAPNGFSNGTSTNAGILKKNRWQKKNLSSQLSSSTTDIASLKFSNLTVGNVYRISFQGYLLIQGTSATEGPLLTANHNGSVIGTVLFRADADTDVHGVAAGTSVIFTAAATTLTFNFTENGTNTLEASNDTFAVLEELNNYESETTAWT